MKRLTINHIAAANLKHNRRAYLSMAAGILVAVFLITSLCLCVQGVAARRAEDLAEKFGRMDMFTLNERKLTDEELLDTGFFTPDIGHVYVTAKVTDSTVPLGWYDETAERLMNRRLLEGRMPEKPGEIALEPSVLDRLQVEATVGDTLTLSLTPLEGLAEERTYTIVGLLNEQTRTLDSPMWSTYGAGCEAFPAILTCAEEPAFASGAPTQHHLLTLKGGVSKYEALKAFDYGGTNFDIQMWSVSPDGKDVQSGSFLFSPQAQWIALLNDTTLILTCMLGGALLVAICAAIAGAMESQLARKTEEIGMLRAVGATKRQIRRIFGRESWLMAALAAPAGIVLACLFAWGLSRVAPGYMMFRPTLWLLLPVLLLVVATILVSSSFPLRRASHIMPMSVLRDTALLRKAWRIRSHKQFRAPALVSRRQLTLHPTRLIGSVVLVVVMLVTAGIGVSMMGTDAKEFLDDTAAFQFGGNGITTLTTASFADDIPTETITGADLNQIAALPMVSDVRVRRKLKICFETDKVSRYYTYRYGWQIDLGGNSHLANEAQRKEQDAELAAYIESLDLPYEPAPNAVSWSDKVMMDYWAAQKALGTDRALVKMELVVLAIDIEDLAPYIAEGKLDVEAINAGREVIVYAPNYYEYPIDGTDGGMSVGIQYVGDYYQDLIVNDVLTVGQELPIAQFYGTMEELRQPYEETQEGLDGFYENIHLRRATVTVGALLGDLQRAPLHDRPWDACIITTDEGLHAMGLYADKLMSAEVFLSGSVDEETEKWLENRVTSIASRGAMTVTNSRAELRELWALQKAVVIVFACIALVFFAAAMGMISGNVSRRIRADSRMIGTLRAVGADDRALIGCYSGSVFITIALGTIIAFPIVRYMQRYMFDIKLAFIVMLVLAVLMLGCCLGVLRLRIHDAMKKSIVENIREL